MNALALAPLLAVGLIGLVYAARRAAMHRQRAALVGSAAGAGVGGGTLLFFSGAGCTVCHTAQKPALDRLAPRLAGRVTVREVDVAAEPDLAGRYRVMTLPTTVIVDAGGRVAAVNTGFASRARLEDQLVAAGLVSGEVPALQAS